MKKARPAEETARVHFPDFVVPSGLAAVPHAPVGIGNITAAGS
jgi:hypothetical protein